MPRLEKTPGFTDTPGPNLGEHTTAVLTEILSLSQEQITTLKNEDVI